MPFIGVQPASALLTSADIQDGQITTAKIANDAVDNTKLDLTSSYDFSAGLTLGDNLTFDVAGKGVHLGVTSATSANFLGDYEEGSFNPTLKNESGGALTTTKTSNNVGTYVKIGGVVFFQFIIQISAISGGSTSNLSIDNMPFTANALSTHGYGGCMVGYNAFNSTPPTYGIVIANSDDLRLYTAPTQPMTSNQLTSSSYIVAQGQYETSS